MPHAPEAAIDLAHLDRYTGGNRALNEEVLCLFRSQCDDLVRQLEALAMVAPDPEAAKRWDESAHTLKGAARGVGAFTVAAAAAALEKVGLSEPEVRLAAIGQLKTAADAVHHFVSQFLAQTS